MSCPDLIREKWKCSSNSVPLSKCSNSFTSIFWILCLWYPSTHFQQSFNFLFLCIWYLPIPFKRGQLKLPITHHTMKKCRRVTTYFYAFLISALQGSVRLHPLKELPRSQYGCCDEEKMHATAENRTSITHPVARSLDWDMPAWLFMSLGREVYK